MDYDVHPEYVGDQRPVVRDACGCSTFRGPDVQTPQPVGVAPSDRPSREYDVFISHASKGKDTIVRPLARALFDGGLSVWYDVLKLRIRGSLRRKIGTGIVKSRYGVVVLSRSFFDKGWTNYELDGLVAHAVSSEQVLLLIWH